MPIAQAMPEEGSPETESPTATLEDVRMWLQQMIKRRMYRPEAWDRINYGLKNIEPVARRTGIPLDARSLLANADSLVSLWAEENNITPGGAHTCGMRVKSVLRAYIAYQESPETFKPRLRPDLSKREKKPMGKQMTAQKKKPGRSAGKIRETAQPITTEQQQLKTLVQLCANLQVSRITKGEGGYHVERTATVVVNC